MRNGPTQPRPWAVTRDDLETFLGREDWAPETRKSARAAVRGFYRWAHGTGRIPDDPARDLPPIRVPQGVPRPAPEHLVRVLVRTRGRVGVMAPPTADCDAGR